MSEQSGRGDALGVVAGLHAIVDRFDPAELTTSAGDVLLEFWRELERFRNRLATVEHQVIAEVREHHLTEEHGARDLTAFARQLLRCSASDARARVAAAEAAGPHRHPASGEPCPPQFPLVAAAQASGVMSPAHARLVVTTVNRIPNDDLDLVPDIEQLMVDHAEVMDVDELARDARQITYHFDQDGHLREANYRNRIRDLRLHPHRDGSARLEADLTVECATRLRTVLDALDRPRLESDGVKDPRTAGQRRHDALLDILELVQRAEQLPATAGVATTVILTISDDSWHSGRGSATTSHGVTIPASEAIRWAGGDARVAAVALNDMKAVTAYSGTHRIFSQTQRLAMIARDRGCTFPGCDVGPAWCQAHHVIDYANGGPTTIDNGALLCGHHHRSFQQLNWRCLMIDGRPHWIPPAWQDPTRTPRRNTHHEPPPNIPAARPLVPA